MSQAETLWFLNAHITLRRPSRASEDGMSITEHWLPEGDSPPLHVHHREDEIFHVLEGIVRVRVGDEEHLLYSGDTAVGPKGVPHTYRVESSEGARVLVMTPGEDFEGFVRDVGRPASRRALPDPGELDPVTLTRLADAAGRRFISLVGPPLAAR